MDRSPAAKRLPLLAAMALGPLWRPRPGRTLVGITALVVLTVLTQIGGLCLWPALGLYAAATTPRARMTAALVFLTLYAAATAFVVPALAAATGRVPLPCVGDGPLQPRSWLFCATNRHYVVPELRAELVSVANTLATEHPGTTLSYLDAGFPFGNGFPLLPHLSHHDGRKVDLALLYADPESGAPLATAGSPFGYFAYVQPIGEPACPAHATDLRWDLDMLQPWFGPPTLDVERTSALVEALVARPGVGKLLLEPHIEQRLTVRSSKVRFQGCRAARHDDHVHVQL